MIEGILQGLSKRIETEIIDYAIEIKGKLNCKVV